MYTSTWVFFKSEPISPYHMQDSPSRIFIKRVTLYGTDVTYHVTNVPETVVTQEKTAINPLQKKRLSNGGCIILCIITPTKWLVSPSKFEPFNPITFGKCRTATQLNYFFPIKVSQALNRKLAGLVSGPGLFIAGKSSFFGFKTPLSSFHGSEWGSTSNTVASNNNK